MLCMVGRCRRGKGGSRSGSVGGFPMCLHLLDLEVFTVSRIGKMPVPVPPGVTVDIQAVRDVEADDRGTIVKVTRPQGFAGAEPFIRICNHVDRVGDRTGRPMSIQIVVTRPSDQRQHKALHGLTRALINNMVIGVNRGVHQSPGHYRGWVSRFAERRSDLVLQLGHSHAVEVVPPPGSSSRLRLELGATDRSRARLLSGASTSSSLARLLPRFAPGVRRSPTRARGFAIEMSTYVARPARLAR